MLDAGWVTRHHAVCVIWSTPALPALPDADGNTSVSGEGGSSGVGFVTPSNLVANVANRIIVGSPASHARLGVSLTSSR
jgi:hypothetical protein